MQIHQPVCLVHFAFRFNTVLYLRQFAAGRARWPLRRAACIDSLVFLGLIRVERRKDWTATL